MIGIEILGRLGNQMFQYAFAYSRSKELNTSFFLLETNNFYIHKYFNIGFSPFLNKLESYSFRAKHLFNYAVFTEDQKLTRHEQDQKFTLDDVIYKGFYQSVDYFIGHEKAIREFFSLRGKYKIDIRKVIARSQKPILAIHVRLTDYKNFGNRNMALPLQYYEDCFRQIGDLDRFEVWVVSDAIDEARNFFSAYNSFNFALNTNLITDFQILQQADTLIIANSSFSWWAAYLNGGSMIFAPKYWLGRNEQHEHPGGISAKLGWVWVG